MPDFNKSKSKAHANDGVSSPKVNSSSPWARPSQGPQTSKGSVVQPSRKTVSQAKGNYPQTQARQQARQQQGDHFNKKSQRSTIPNKPNASNFQAHRKSGQTASANSVPSKQSMNQTDSSQSYKQSFSSLVSKAKTSVASIASSSKVQKDKLVAKFNKGINSKRQTPNKQNIQAQGVNRSNIDASMLQPQNTPVKSMNPKPVQESLVDSNPKQSSRESQAVMNRAVVMPPVNVQELRRLRRHMKPYLSGRPIKSSISTDFFHVIGSGIFRILKVALIMVIIIGIFTTFTLGGVLAGYLSTTQPVPNKLLNQGTGDQTSYIYYGKNNNVLAKLTGAHNIDREYISYEKVKDTYIAYAFMAIEDERFMQNIGINPRRIASAAISAVLNSGRATHGGSTITQQTVKLLTGDDQRSAQRKVQEWYRAVLLNQSLSKTQIMEIYLNLVPMANSYIGIQSAAKAYFDKDASELNLAECAFLAAIPKSPSSYNPLRELGRRNALRRQRIVLSRMHKLGFITEQAYQDALNYDLKFRTSKRELSGTDIQTYFAEYVIESLIRDLQRKAGYSETVARRLVNSGGLRIYSTMDASVQNILDRWYGDPSNFQKAPWLYEDEPETPQSAMIIIDNKNGNIVGMSGGVGQKKGNFVLNRATDISRQPGSSIKPIAVYAPALNEGIIGRDSTILDEPVYLDPGNPKQKWPLNYTRTYAGRVSIQQALAWSLNVPAVKILKDLGVETSREYLSKNGVDVSDDESQLSLGIGAMTYGVSPLEMAGAFQTFANHGVHITPKAYSHVDDASGQLFFNNQQEDTPVYTAGTAYTMTQLLNGVVTQGTASAYGEIFNNQGGRIETCGKTGTTDNEMDRWFVGFTPYYSAAVWYGFDNSIKTNFISHQDNNNVLETWFKVMRQVHKNREAVRFQRPENLVEVRVCSVSGELANSNCFANGTAVVSYFEAGSPLIPKNYCHIHNSAPETSSESSETSSEDDTTSAQDASDTSAENNEETSITEAESVEAEAANPNQDNGADNADANAGN